MRLKLVVVATLGFAGFASLAEADVPETAEQFEKLRDASRITRIEAARQLVRLPQLPESAVDQILGFIKREVDSVTTPSMNEKDYQFKERMKATDIGDAVSFTRIKANPKDYIGSEFVIAGGLRATNYYNFGFSKAADAYYSFNITPFRSDGSLDFDSEGIYMMRILGQVLAETTTRCQEQKGALLAIKLRCKIDSRRCEGDPSNAINSIEVIDWQLPAPGGKAWMPWALEGIGLGCRMLFLTGKPSVPKCLDLVLDENLYQNETTDLFLRVSVVLYLSELPKSTRALMVKQIANRAKRVKSARSRVWARRVMNSVSSGTLSL